MSEVTDPESTALYLKSDADLLPGGGMETLEAASCAFKYRDFVESDNAASSYFANDDRYQMSFGREGTNLLSEIDTVISRAGGLNATELVSRVVASPDGRLKIGSCTRPDSGLGDGATSFTWYSQRVGPFRSFGGNDWWITSWEDALSMSSLIASPGEVGINAHISVTLDGSGSIISFPPLHPHHIQLYPESLNNRAGHGDAGPHMTGLRVTDAARLFTHAGDWECQAEQGCARTMLLPGLMLLRSPALLVLDAPVLAPIVAARAAWLSTTAPWSSSLRTAPLSRCLSMTSVLRAREAGTLNRLRATAGR
jgi:hypothetical protein